MRLIYLLHNYHPEPILLSLGNINIYWYGLFIVSGALTAIFITLKLAGYYGIKKESIIDLSFWLIIFGVIGARIYHVLLELPYYTANPLNIFKFWQGGLAIHGAILAGIATIYFYSKKYKLNFWAIGALITPGLALAQAIGRWGNYFNQELFGKPTNLPWGIAIDILNRPAQFLDYTYFQPTFLYESLGNFCIFIILLLANFYFIKRYHGQATRVISYKLLVTGYLFLYSVLRFTMEFIRIDQTPIIFGWRFPQLISIIIMALVIIILFFHKFKRKNALE